MVDITPPVGEGRQIIQRYGDGGFRIAGVEHSGSVLIEAEQTRPWPVQESASISIESLRPLTETVGPAAPGGCVLLLGTGTDMGVIDNRLRADLRGMGIGLEVMSTGAACRTFNVLLAEDRAVMAALIAVE